MSPCIDHGKKGNRDGYAQINRDGFYFLHRLVHAQANGLTAEQMSGTCVRHRCDNARCINEDHLLSGSWADNNRDRAERGRSAKTQPDKRRLTDKDADFIRNNLILGDREFGANAMAKRFCVDRKTIYMLRAGTTYHTKGTQ